MEKQWYLMFVVVIRTNGKKNNKDSNSICQEIFVLKKTRLLMSYIMKIKIDKSYLNTHEYIYFMFNTCRVDAFIL